MGVGYRCMSSLLSFLAFLVVLVPLSSGAEVCEAEEAGRLRPNHLKDMPVYTGFHLNHTVTLASKGREGSFEYVPGATLQVAEGAIDHRGVDGESSFSVLTGVVTQEEVSSILALVNASNVVTFDSDPDTVDGMSTHEIFVDNDDLRRGSLKESMKLDGTAKGLAERRPLREQLQKIMRPILDERITPYVREHFPEMCNKDPERACTPCYSLVRRYRPGERRSHETHRDGHALVTVVVSLSDYGSEYRGGIYVAHNRADKKVLALKRGDAVVHQSDLLHGVKVKDDGGERWSWILWFKDSTECHDSDNAEWFRECANEGSAVCQAQFASAAGVVKDIIKYNGLAANQGFGESQVKMARAYLKLLHSHLEYDPEEAERLYRSAIASSEEPDAQYGLAQMLLMGTAVPGGGRQSSLRDMLKEVVALLEAAAQSGHTFAMFNLGIAHLFGYITPSTEGRIVANPQGAHDPELAGGWFEASGLPEGFFSAAMYYDSIGNTRAAKHVRAQAETMGYGSEWRKTARQRTGSGGAGGVDINLPWPALPNGSKPPQF